MRKIGKRLLLILGVLVVAEIADTLLRTYAWRSRDPRALHLIKSYNKYVFNPVMLRFAGRSGVSAIVHHVGRRSGTPYATPVIAHQFDEDVIIPLPYGTDVDWLRNVLAAGQVTVDLNALSLRVEEPAIVDIDNVIGFLPASMVRTVRLNGAREAVRLYISPSTTPA